MKISFIGCFLNLLLAFNCLAAETEYRLAFRPYGKDEFTAPPQPQTLMSGGGDVLTLIRMNEKGKIFQEETCNPKLPKGSDIGFNTSGKGVVIVPGTTNSMPSEVIKVTSSLKEKYGIDLFACPSVLDTTPVLYATRNASDTKLAILMQDGESMTVQDGGPLLIVDKNFKGISSINEKGIAPPSWSPKTDNLAFYHRPDPHRKDDNFGFKLFSMNGAKPELLYSIEPKFCSELIPVREPPEWNALEDVLWVTSSDKESKYLTMFLTLDFKNSVSKNVLKDVIESKAIPFTSNWLFIGNGYLHTVVSSAGELIETLGKPGGNGEVVCVISPQLFIVRQEKSHFYLAGPGFKVLSELKAGHYWVINSSSKR